MPAPHSARNTPTSFQHGVKTQDQFNKSLLSTDDLVNSKITQSLLKCLGYWLQVYNKSSIMCKKSMYSKSKFFRTL